MGAGVTDYAPGDLVVSTFFTNWDDGTPPATAFTTVPGDGIDGYARTEITAPAGWFTRVPKGYSAAEAATLTCAGLTAWRALFVDGAVKPGSTVLVQGTGGVFGLRAADGQGCRRARDRHELVRPRSWSGCAPWVRTISSTTSREVAWGLKALELTGGAGRGLRGRNRAARGTLDQSMMAARVGRPCRADPACWQALPARCRLRCSWPRTCVCKA